MATIKQAVVESALLALPAFVGQSARGLAVLICPALGLSSVAEAGQYENGQLVLPPVVTNALNKLAKTGAVYRDPANGGGWTRHVAGQSVVIQALKPEVKPEVKPEPEPKPEPKPEPEVKLDVVEGGTLYDINEPATRAFFALSQSCFGDFGPRAPECKACLLQADCQQKTEADKEAKAALKAARQAQKEAAAAAAAAHPSWLQQMMDTGVSGYQVDRGRIIPIGAGGVCAVSGVEIPAATQVVWVGGLGAVTMEAWELIKRAFPHANAV